MTGHVIAITDYFGPTLYLADAKRWVFGDGAHEARVFTDDEKSLWQLRAGEEWKPASDLVLNKAGEKGPDGRL